MEVRKIDTEGLFLCELQAKVFESSLTNAKCSSEIFIRRFMNSKIAENIDDSSILVTNLLPIDVIEEIEKQYGDSSYGSVKYSANELFWIGYFYRYFSYTYNFSSSKVYKIIKPKELRGLFLPYHTLDVSQAIERVLEARGMLLDEESELQRQYIIFKKYHKVKL